MLQQRTRESSRTDFPPFKPRLSPAGRRLLVTSAVAVITASAAAGALLGLHRHQAPRATDPCAACVTYGSRIFDPSSHAMRAVETAIDKENAAVRASGKPYVTVALLIPLTNESTSDAWLSRMVDQLRGAYLAQASMNSQDVLGVQLLLDNEGTSAELTEGQAVRQLETMEGPSTHLVAVVGMGVSIDNTAAAAKALVDDHMPMFGAVMSADKLNGTYFKGLDQIVPDDSAQVAALAAGIPAPGRAVLVYDQQDTDLYTANLRADFTRTFRKSRTSVAHPFTSGARGTNLEFKMIAAEVCFTVGPPPVIFYAGRASVLSSLIQKFQDDNNCQDKKITMVTAGDGDGLSPEITKSPPGSGQVSVIYSDVFNLNKITASFKASYARQLASIDPGATGLGDTWTIGTYNAMEAAWAAIQLGYKASTPAVPAKSDVLEMSVQLNGEYAPLGATGPFSIGTDGRLMSPDIPIFEDSGGTRITLRN